MNQSGVTVDNLNERMLGSLLPVTIFIILELTIGFFGNCLILCVYLRAYTHCNFRYFVLFLAVYDLTSCFTTLPGEVYAHFNWYDYKFDWLCKVKSFFNVFTAWGSAFTLFLLALDRCMKICRPLNRQIRPVLARKLCILGFLLSISVSVPILFLWGLQSYTYKRDNIVAKVSICEKSSSHTSDNYPFIYISSVYSGPIGLMMGAISVCNIMLVRTLMRRMFKYTEKNNNRIRILSFHRNGIKNKNARKISLQQNGIKTDSSFTSLTAAIANCVTQIATLDNAVIPTSNSTINQSTSNESQHSLEYEVDIKNEEETLKNIDSPSVPGNFTNRIHTSHCGQTTRSYKIKMRKTLIMLTLTSVYIVTMTTYICLVSMVAEKGSILRRLSEGENVVFFFFLRLYFVNSSINPILYGIMDPRFKNGLKQLLCRNVRKVSQ